MKQRWKKNGLDLKFNSIAIYLASMNGHVKVLDLWKESGLELRYSENAMDKASRHVLDW
mgnify:CR=1 FL=1